MQAVRKQAGQAGSSQKFVSTGSQQARMQLTRYHLSNFFVSFGLILASLLAVVWLNQALRLMELVINRGAPLADFLLLSILSVPLWLMVAVPLAGFIAVIFVYNRMFSDRELIVAQSFGISPLQLARLPLLFGAGLTAILAVNSLWLLPASFSHFKELQMELRSSVPKILVRNGVFVGLDENLTIFIGEKQADKQIGQVFIQDTRQPDKIVTYTAGNGRFTLKEGRQMLVLEQGQRTEISRQGGNSALLEFDSHSLDISRSSVQQINQRALDSNEESITALFSDTEGLAPKYVAERQAQAHYRITAPIMCLSLSLLAAAMLLRGSYARSGQKMRVVRVVLAGLALQIAFVLSRSAIANLPYLWPLIYLICLLPMPVCLYWLARKKPLLETPQAALMGGH